MSWNIRRLAQNNVAQYKCESAVSRITLLIVVHINDVKQKRSLASIGKVTVRQIVIKFNPLHKPNHKTAHNPFHKLTHHRVHKTAHNPIRKPTHYYVHKPNQNSVHKPAQNPIHNPAHIHVHKASHNPILQNN
jgi:hypothetical protein